MKNRKIKRSFKSPARQARECVEKLMVTGIPRHGNREDGLIHSFGSARLYVQCLKQAAEWGRSVGIPYSLNHWMQEDAMEYLKMRSKIVGEKQIRKDLRALELVIGIKLDHVKSEIPTKKSNRTYSSEQISSILEHQTVPNAISTRIVISAGLRAHELFELDMIENQPRSDHRTWRADLFMGLPGEDYSVKGKGGLIRMVRVPFELAQLLEARRLATPKITYDRGVRYKQKYDIGAGQAWSMSFSRASMEAFGKSRGGHGLRHSYVSNRLKTLKGLSVPDDIALEIVSQELGHFRKDITKEYVRD